MPKHVVPSVAAPVRGASRPTVRRAGFLLVVLFLPVALIGGCSGGGVLTAGGWVFEGDDVIRVRPRQAQTQEEALGRVVRTIEQSPFELDTLSRASGYARTRAWLLNGTSDRGDAPAVRLNVVVTDSATVEVAGQVTVPQSPDGETSSSREWTRVTWRQGVQTGTTPWGVMRDFAQLIGNIQGYEEDPTGLDSFACGGRRCAAEQVCLGSVCRSDQREQPAGRNPTKGGGDACLSAEEKTLISKIRAYRDESGRPQIPISASLTHVADAHVRDLAEHTPHREGSRCNLHSWSGEGEGSACCYTPDHAQAQCMWKKPQELTDYPASGFEIAARGRRTAQAALSGWRSSPKHNAVLVNRGDWRRFEWEAMGVGMHEGYAVVWFGREPDPAGAPPRCGADQ